MKLLKLQLTNFQGISALELDFQAQSGSVYGRNATGKTTIYNALTWLLTDKPSTGAKGYSPKTNSETGEVHNMHHMATASFRCSDGRIVTFGKDYHEVYRQKRGSNNSEFAGHTTDYSIDGVPVSEAEYQKKILMYAKGTSEQIRMILTPLYFVEDMAWQKRRETLLDIAGDVSDDEVIQSSEKLKDLTKYLAITGTDNQFYSVEEYRKIAAEKQRKINQGLNSLPARIDEARKAIPDLTALNEEELEIGISTLEKQRETLMTEKAQTIGQDTVEAEYRTLLAQERAKLAEARGGHNAQSAKINEKIYKSIEEIRQKQTKAQGELMETEFAISSTKQKIENLEQHRRELVEKYTEISCVNWDEKKSICPTCQRPLPVEEIESMKADFNLDRSRRLEKINLQGKNECSQEMIDSKKTVLNNLLEKEQTLRNSIDEFKREIREKQSFIQETEPFESTEIYQEISANISKYESGQSDAREKANALTVEKDRQIKEISERISETRRDLQKFDIKRAQEKRIVELEGAEKDLAAEFETVERGLYLCECFIRQKVSLLDEKINHKFKNVRFRLFVQQINGGLKEDCEVLVPSPDGRMVPFANANNAARMNAALEIVEILAEHWGIDLPIFVDNAESVTDLYCSDHLQIVRLVVSKNHDVLTLEGAAV